ncbi:MAG: hypothetical protein JWQ73_4288 [Variovorax sp.]|nr:hypothetical protein [Variovorax sp.]
MNHPHAHHFMYSLTPEETPTALGTARREV